MCPSVPRTPSESTRVTDLLIVESGSVGPFACHCAGMRDLDVALLDSLRHLGGITALNPDKETFDPAGFPTARVRESLARLSERGSTTEPSILLGGPDVRNTPPESPAGPTAPGRSGATPLVAGWTKESK